MKGTTINLIRSDSDGSRRAITKIIPMTDGFSLLVPYHSAKSCYLMKSPVDYSKGLDLVPLNSCVTCEASNRVKLSIHFPGFAQFSGENSQLIISGRDPGTGVPRGLGIANDRPFDIRSGPVAGLGIWGISDFREVRNSKAQINLFEAKSILRDHPAGSVIELYIEVWMIPRHYRVMIADYLGQPMIRMVLPQFSGLEFPQDLYVVDLPNQSHFLGIQLIRCRRTHGNRDDGDDVDYPPSGFTLSGPAALDEHGQYWSLGAFFPRPEAFPSCRNLDRVKNQNQCTSKFPSSPSSS